MERTRVIALLGALARGEEVDGATADTTARITFHEDRVELVPVQDADVQTAPHPDPEFSREGQWRAFLSDLAQYPTFTEDLWPNLQIRKVWREGDEAFVQIAEGGRTARYRFRLDQELEFPMGMTDAFRQAFPGPGEHPWAGGLLVWVPED